MLWKDWQIFWKSLDEISDWTNLCSKSAPVYEKYDIRIVQYWIRFGAQTNSFYNLGRINFSRFDKGQEFCLHISGYDQLQKNNTFFKKVGLPYHGSKIEQDMLKETDIFCWKCRLHCRWKIFPLWFSGMPF